MALILKRIGILIIVILINVIKTENYVSKTLSSMRFLIDNNENLLKTEENDAGKYEDKTKFNYLFDSIKNLKTLRIFQESGSSSVENDGFKVRCFWLDSKTLRVFD